MWKVFTEKNNRQWTKILQFLIDTYNDSVHRTIKMTPNEASKSKNDSEVLYNMENVKPIKVVKPKLQVKDWVRISRIKGVFEKGYIRNWSIEIFQVSEVLLTKPVTCKIIEYDKTPIEGSFYEQELQKTENKNEFLIDKVLKTRKVKGKTEHLVHWLGWGNKYDIWVTDDELKDLD
jgi:hypothetical protein